MKALLVISKNGRQVFPATIDTLYHKVTQEDSVYCLNLENGKWYELFYNYSCNTMQEFYNNIKLLQLYKNNRLTFFPENELNTL